MTLAQQAYNNLTLKQKGVWDLMMRRNYSEYETAFCLNISRDAVHDRINKARRRYKKFILERKKK